jgi:hypothetical protein
MEDERGGGTEETGADAASLAPNASSETPGKTAPAAASEVNKSTLTKSTASDLKSDDFKSERKSESKLRPTLNFIRARRVPLLILMCAALISSFFYLRYRADILGRLRAGADKAKEVLTGQPSTPPDPYAEAVAKVEGDRGEATGRAAQVEVPTELKQYKDTHRFLAIQSAAAAEAGVKPPHDFAALAEMIKGGRELVEAPRLGRGYVLYGVGLTATGELTHYDAERKRSVPLFANVDEVNSFKEGLATESARLEAELKESEGGLKELARNDKMGRARLLASVAAKKKELSGLKQREELVASYYGIDGVKEKVAGHQKVASQEKSADSKRVAGVKKQAARKQKAGKEKVVKDNVADRPKAADRPKVLGSSDVRGRERLFAEYEVLAELARDFGGRAYDLHDKASAKEFQARLLSFIRPAALSVLEELGTAYQVKFDRPLPVTSLVRTEEYQRLLRESGNPNAADVAPPPHTTGFAFDIYYRFMTASEQEFVMGEIARLEREGRVEALRELRDHYHVFAFSEGHRPDEKRVDKILGKKS